MTVNTKLPATHRWIYSHLDYDGESCLPWPFSRDDKGYGCVKFDGRVTKAHRVVCKLVNGPAPDDKPQAGHNCGNGHLGCVHPKHLGWTNNSQNQLDRTAHGRRTGHPYGRKGKLNAEQVAQIQAERGRTPISALAKRFGVKRGAIDYWHKKAKAGQGYSGGIDVDWNAIGRKSADTLRARRR